MQSDTEWGSNLFRYFLYLYHSFFIKHIYFLYSISDLVNKVLPCWLSHCFLYFFRLQKSIVVIEERTEL